MSRYHQGNLETGEPMAQNGTYGGGRVGLLKGRSRTRDPRTGRWSRLDMLTGRFLRAKQAGGSLKSVRRED